jgi:hypothetical protein
MSPRSVFVGGARLVATAALLFLSACSELFGPKDWVVTMDVAPERVPCVGVGPMECLRVREHPDTTWTLFYSGIDGFSFEPGFSYTLRVLVREVPNPPADASSRDYRLLAVLRKVSA